MSAPDQYILQEWIGADGLPYRAIAPAADPIPGQKYELHVKPQGRPWMLVKDWNVERLASGGGDGP